jgi:hypothetical protein
MSAKADMSASSFGASLDVARPSAVPVALGGGTAVASAV